MDSNVRADRVSPRTGIVAGAIVLLVALSGLFLYKWGGAFATVSAVEASGRWLKPADSLTAAGALTATLNYFAIIWPALAFGIVIGAAVRAFISPRWVVRLLGSERPAGRQLAGALAGAPLMLCSCCITPIYSSVRERGAPLGSALALMLGSPGLNIAALILTFLLFAPHIAVARVALTLVAVLGLTALIGKGFEGRVGGASLTKPKEPKACDVSIQDVTSWRDGVLRFAGSLVHITLVTVPLIALGVLLSSLILPSLGSISGLAAVLTIGIVAAVAVLIALPTFFEIPLALLLLQVGAPEGAALALLFAGPIVNLPSLLVLAKDGETRRVSGALALGIFALAFGGGLLLAFV